MPTVILALGYRWEREVFPWLMTWEENHSRQQAPWNGRTLVRGLEFGSYALATSRKANVEMGKLFDQSCFEWLDAKEVIPFPRLNEGYRNHNL